MSTSDLKVNGAGDLLGAVVGMLGYWPSKSLLAIPISDAGTIIVVARVDGGEDSVGIIDSTLDAAQRCGTTSPKFVLATFDSTQDMGAAVERVCDLGLRVIHAIIVEGPLWRCHDGCCAGEFDDSNPLLLEFILREGRNGASRSIADVRSDYQPDADRDPLTTSTVTDDDVKQAWEAVLGNAWTHEHLSALGSTDDPSIRDAVTAALGVHGIAEETGHGQWIDSLSLDKVTLFTGLLSAARGSNLPQLWCVLATAHLLDGHGGRARMAVEAALAADPKYRLAVLTEQILTFGIRVGQGRWAK